MKFPKGKKLYSGRYLSICPKEEIKRREKKEERLSFWIPWLHLLCTPVLDEQDMCIRVRQAGCQNRMHSTRKGGLRLELIAPSEVLFPNTKVFFWEPCRKCLCKMFECWIHCGGSLWNQSPWASVFVKVLGTNLASCCKQLEKLYKIYKTRAFRHWTRDSTLQRFPKRKGTKWKWAPGLPHLCSQEALSGMWGWEGRPK